MAGREATGVDAGTGLHHFALNHLSHSLPVPLLHGLQFVDQKLDLIAQLLDLLLIILTHDPAGLLPLFITLFQCLPLTRPLSARTLYLPIDCPEVLLPQSDRLPQFLDLIRVVILHLIRNFRTALQLLLETLFLLHESPLPLLPQRNTLLLRLFPHHLYFLQVEMSSPFVEIFELSVIVLQIVDLLLQQPIARLQLLLLSRKEIDSCLLILELLQHMLLTLGRTALLLPHLCHDLQLLPQVPFSKVVLLELRSQELILSDQVQGLSPMIKGVIHGGCVMRIISCVRQQFRLITMSAGTQQLLRRLKAVFPDLSQRTKKGENGRIAVVGGSFQFTGAPFYSAISALKVGGDLSHIFCSKFSSPAIKSYSPEIIVHPVFVSEEEAKFAAKEVEAMTEEWASKLKGWEKAIHSWIIGPGLGRDRYMQQFLPLLIKNLPDQSLVIFDADGIYYLCHRPELFNELHRFRAILTPNYRELAILQKVYKIDVDQILRNNDSREEISEISCKQAFPHFKLLIKGQSDIILAKDRSFVVRTEGGKKRCGGMGDILAGVLSVSSLWDYEYGPALASRIVRLATRAGFEKEGRGLTAPSVISELSQIVKNIERDIY